MDNEKQTDLPRIEVPDYADVDLEICLRDPQTGELKAFMSLMHLFEWVNAKINNRAGWSNWGN